MKLALFTLALTFVIVSCNQDTETTKTKTDSDTTKKSDLSSMPDFDESMDATKTAGYPARVIADSLGIKMYEFVVNPGDSVPMHSHPDHAIYTTEGGSVEVRRKDGSTQLLDVKAGMGMISPADQHSAKNVGTTPVKLIIVHVYRDRD